MTRLLIVRHGRTSWNDTGRLQGTTDIDLDEVGRAQAAAAAPLLAAERPDLIVASDLKRAFDTAQPIAELAGLPVSSDVRLRERNYGPWEGLTMAEISVRFPEDHKRWKAGEPLTNPDIETWADLSARAVAAMTDIIDKVGDGTAVVVCHGGSGRQAVGGVLGWTEQMAVTVSGMDNCHWADVRRGTRGWRLYGYNVGAGLPRS